nr:dynamin family protein [uncultured Desulfobacter sp.]
MTDYEKQKKATFSLIEQAKNLAADFKQEEISGRIMEIQKHLLDETLFVVVCGEFKQGKSSLINAFLDEPGLCPVDIDIATNMISTIGYGDIEKISVLTGKRGEEKAKEITRKEIADYGTEQENKGNIKEARLINLEIPNPHLKENLILVDTPGVGGLNADHTELTFAFIPNADAILFVSDAMAPFSAVELDSIQKIYRHCKKIIFVMTKIDSITDYESVLENNKKKLVQVLGIEEEKIVVIPVSSLAKTDYIQSKDAEDLEDSNFTQLEETIWDMINRQKGAMLLMGTLHRIGNELRFLKRPRQAEFESYQKENKAELENQKNEFTKSKERLNDLLEGNAEWRTLLSDGLQDLRRHMTSQFQEGFMKIRHGVNKDLGNPQMIQNPPKMLQKCEYDIDSLMTTLGRNLRQMAQSLHSSIEESSQLDLSNYDTTALSLKKTRSSALVSSTQKDPEGDDVCHKNDLWQNSRTAVRGGLFNFHAGAFVGGLVGVVLGAGVGLLSGGVAIVPGAIIGAKMGAGLGAVGGFASGAKEALEQIKEKDQNKAKQKISGIMNQFLEESQNRLLQTFTDVITQLERSMRDEFSRQLKQEKSSIEEALKRIQHTGTLTRKQAQKKSAEVKVSLNKIDTVLHKLESISNEVLRTTSPEPEKKSSDFGDWANA